MVISYEKAICIAKCFAQEITQKYQDQIRAVFAIGSLGSDYYRPGQSDIDTAIITTHTRETVIPIQEDIEKTADQYWIKFQVPKGFGAIVFAEEQLYPPYIKNEELILEILRLKTQNKLLYGDYNVNDIPMPDKQAIIEDAKSFQEWADAEKIKNPEFGIASMQMFVNSTLIALKRYLLIQCGIIEFNKFKVIDLYLNNNPPAVNEEAFYLIQSYLHNEAIEVKEEQFQSLVEWHDRLYTVINHIVLYPDKM